MQTEEARDSSPGGRSAEGAGRPAFADVSSFASSKVFFTSSQNFLVSTSFTGVDSVPLMAYLSAPIAVARSPDALRG
jgi:hypothetical protein